MFYFFAVLWHFLLFYSLRQVRCVWPLVNLFSIYGPALIGFSVVPLRSAVNQPLNQQKRAKYESARGTREGQ